MGCTACTYPLYDCRHIQPWLFESFFRHLLLELVPFGDVSDMSELQERTNDLGYSPYKLLSGLVVLPVVAILFLACSHVWTAYAHIIFWAVSFSFLFKSIANAPSLITANILSMNLFIWGMCGVVYSNFTFYFLHDWCSPALSQRRYLTRVPRDVIFSKNISYFSEVDTLFSYVGKNVSRNRTAMPTRPRYFQLSIFSYLLCVF